MYHRTHQISARRRAGCHSPVPSCVLKLIPTAAANYEWDTNETLSQWLQQTLLYTECSDCTCSEMTSMTSTGLSMSLLLRIPNSHCFDLYPEFCMKRHISIKCKDSIPSPQLGWDCAVSIIVPCSLGIKLLCSVRVFLTGLQQWSGSTEGALQASCPCQPHSTLTAG